MPKNISKTNKKSGAKKEVKVLVLSGYGLNCEEETKYAFESAGAKADIVHINDLIDGLKKMKNYDIMAFPGGFSYGDDTGSGKAYANKLRNHLSKDIQEFVSANKLVIGICNGFQIITNLGLLPGGLAFNKQARYLDRWVDLKMGTGGLVSQSPWLKGINELSLPIAHGEGRYTIDAKGLAQLKKEGGIAFTYVKGEICNYQDLPANPNGALEDIAGVTGHDGRILGLMPHPERALFTEQLPHFPYLREKALRDGKDLSKVGPGFQLFKNAVDFFS